MTKTSRVLLALAGLAAALAIPAAVASAQATRTVTINLAAATSRDDPRGGVNGTATLTDMGNGTTQVVLRVAQPTSDNMPAHFHTGKCPNVGAVIYPLNNLVGGTSTSTVNTTIADLLAGRGAPDGTFAINLHRSTAEAGVYVSCGNVVAGAAALPATGGHSSTPVAPILGGASVALAGAAAFVARRRRA